MAGEERAEDGRGRGGGKLSLKRRRQPGPLGDGVPLPCPLRTLASSSSWFENKRLSDAENTWITLLRAVDPRLNRSSLEKEINFPEFCTKSSQIANPQPNPETFNTGMKQFQWIPFPLYHKEVTNANDSRSHQNSENETVRLMERENSEDERLGAIFVAPKQVPLTINEYATEESRMKSNIKHSTKLESRERIEMCQLIQQQKSPGHSPSTQNHPKLWKGGTTTQSEGEIRREDERSANTDVLVHHSNLFNEATSRLPAQPPPSASFSIEKTGNHILTLDQCPMCQIHFTDTLSKLDLDSHLAKCLSESAEDVIW